MLLHDIAFALARYINPLLTAGLVAAPLWRDTALGRARTWRAALVFWAGAALACVVATLLAEWGKAARVVPGNALFPSGHTAYATAAAAFLALAMRGWPGACAVALALAMGAAVVLAGWHAPIDVLGGWPLGALVGAGCYAAAKRIAQRSLRRA